MYSLVGDRICHDGEELLPKTTVDQLLVYVLTRKQRKKGKWAEMQKQLRELRRTSYTWRFTYRKRQERHSMLNVKLRIREAVPGYYRVTCFGSYAEWVVERGNEGPKRHQRWLEQKKLHAQKKKHKVEKKKKKRIYESKKRKEQVKQTFVPAPISRRRNEILTPQFRKSRVSWREMMSAVIEIFDVKRDWKYTAEQLVAREIMTSLRQSGHCFVEYSRRGFKLRFDLVDGIWRGDITPLTISCTKDKDNPLYRRTRDYFAERLLGHCADKQRERRELLWGCEGKVVEYKFVA